MFPTITAEDQRTTGILAGGIALLLVLGVLGVVFKSVGDDKPSPTEVQQQQEEAERRRQQQASEEARAREAADRAALSTIEAQQQACRTKYLPEANRRAEEARQQLRELEASLKQVVAQLPAGKAKDMLGAQIPPDVASAMELINAEQRSIETRCKMAFTIYTYTREAPPPAEPPG